MDEMDIKYMFDNFYEGKKVLITGDSGFKGSWLAVWLLEMGASVYGYSLPPKTEKDNFKITKLADKIHHKDGDIRDLNNLKKYFKEVSPDIVFHLAAQPLVLDSYQDPKYTFETNIIGTVNLFEAIRETESVKACINVTTDKCYKNNEWIWGYRENDPVGGDDPYSASKGCSEIITNSYIKSFFSESECNIASARAGNVIGAGDWAGNRIIPDIFRAYNRQNNLFIRNPNSTRPWQHVLEPLSGYLLLAKKLYENSEYVGAWNFGPRDEMNYSVLKLFEEINTYIDINNVELGKLKKQYKESNLLKLDISKAISSLKWKPLLNFKETVKLTVEGYISDIHNKDAYENRKKTIKNYIEKSELIF